MQWKPPSERAQLWLLSPIIVPVVILGAPFMLLLAGWLWLARKIWPAHPWRPWFAWRPVKPDAPWSDKWVWLETIEARRSWNGARDYRIPEEPKP
jgi:hypothetical protein